LSGSAAVDAGSRSWGRKFPVVARKVPKRPEESSDAPEGGGESQGPSRRCAFASVRVGHKPQEGWYPGLAIQGNTKLPTIETLQRPLGGFVSFTGGGITECPFAGDPNEVQERRARQNVLVVGREKALKRKPGRICPALAERSWRACEVRAQPQGRRWDETSPPWLRAKQDVESVRNAADGRCRRLEPAG
jgi:hypothetical protein